MNQVAINSAKSLLELYDPTDYSHPIVIVLLREQLKLSIAIAESLVQIEYHTNLLCQQDNHHR